MTMYSWLRSGLAGVAATAMLAAQVAPPIMYTPPPKPQAQQPAQPPPAKPEAPKPKPAEQQPAPQAPPAAKPAPEAQGSVAEVGGLELRDVSLVDMIDILARRLKINYILDPRVKGNVIINTYGPLRPADLMQLLQTILRINGATMVQVGDLYRIVPLASAKQMPIPVTVDGKEMATDERMVLNLVFLKYATAEEMAKILQPFLGEGGEITAYVPANLLMILDNTRNMRRTMDLLGMFDSDTFAGQRVRLFEVSHGRPTDISEELDAVFRAYALSEKTASVRFLPIDRINTIIAVAPNPGIFAEVEKWIEKLDVPVKVTAGSVGNYVYRLKYGRAETIAMAVMALYTGNVYALAGLAAMSSMNNGMGGMGGAGMYGMGGMGMYGMGGMGMYGMGGMGGMGMYGMGGMGMYGMGAYGMGGYPAQPLYSTPSTATAEQAATSALAQGTATPGQDLTGSYLGYGRMHPGRRIPHVIPNPFDNTLLVQATPQEWEQITNLLDQLDVPPRQVLVEARIYEVDLTGTFASGVAAFLRRRGDNGSVGGDDDGKGGTELSRTLLGAAGGGGVNLTAGLLVGQSRQLLAILTAEETNKRARVISEPSVIATDSIPASITVGQEVPTLSSQALTGAQQGGNSLFANTVTNRNAGVTLALTARVNSSGIVTMVINQEVSEPQAPPTNAAIQSPSFSKRNISTQVTVQDGDTIAIGGIIQESDGLTTSGVPLLHRIPILGAAFGNKSATKARTELIVFLTPRVIYDTNQIAEATDELTGRLKRLKRSIKP